jgi:hypothetical protein
MPHCPIGMPTVLRCPAFPNTKGGHNAAQAICHNKIFRYLHAKGLKMSRILKDFKRKRDMYLTETYFFWMNRNNKSSNKKKHSSCLSCLIKAWLPQTVQPATLAIYYTIPPPMASCCTLQTEYTSSTLFSHKLYKYRYT